MLEEVFVVKIGRKVTTLVNEKQRAKKRARGMNNFEGSGGPAFSGRPFSIC